jgi:hypothetical protein
LGDWERAAYFVTDRHAFALRALEKLRLPRSAVLASPLAAGLGLKDALFGRRLPPAPASVEVAVVEGFDERFDRFDDELVRQNPEKLLAARDSRSLAWHYRRPLRRGRLRVFTATRAGLLRAYAVVKRQDLGEPLRRARLVDYQTLEPGVDLLPALLRAALRYCASEGFGVLEHLGCSLPKMRSFDRLAPYRRALPAWPYYYHAPDPATWPTTWPRGARPAACRYVIPQWALGHLAAGCRGGWPTRNRRALLSALRGGVAAGPSRHRSLTVAALNPG